MSTRSSLSRCPSTDSYTPPPTYKSQPLFKLGPTEMDEAQSVSYIIIHDLSPEARMLYLSPSLTEVLGYEPRDIIGTSSFDWMHPDEVDAARKLHYDTIRYDKAAAMAYLRIRNQEDRWVYCVIQRSMVHNALIGSISFAKPGAKALHTAATAQEVTFLTPTAPQMQFEFRKWNDPITAMSPPPQIPVNYSELFRSLPVPSKRTGLILDRFSRQCPILYCTNDCILPAARVFDRSFYDFVSPRDEANVRGWIDVSKGWGVSDSGLPSDGGFVFGSFKLLLEGRNSAQGRGREVLRRNRRNTDDSNDESPAKPQQVESEVAVDAIFSAHSDGFIVVLRKAEPSQRR